MFGLMSQRRWIRKPQITTVAISLLAAAAVVGIEIYRTETSDFLIGKVRYVWDWFRFGGDALENQEWIVTYSRNQIAKGQLLPTYYACLSSWERRYGSRQAAIRYLKEGIRTFPDAVGLYFDLAAIYLEDGKKEKALDLMKKCPCKNWFYYSCLGRLQAYAGDMNGAKTSYETALSLFTSKPPAGVNKELTERMLRSELQDVIEGKKPTPLHFGW